MKWEGLLLLSLSMKSNLSSMKVTDPRSHRDAAGKGEESSLKDFSLAPKITLVKLANSLKPFRCCARGFIYTGSPECAIETLGHRRIAVFTDTGAEP